MLVAQISDLHVRAKGERGFGGQIDTAARLAEAVDFVNALSPRPDIVVATGDLVDTGAPAEYANLAGILARLEPPLVLIPGNHDARPALRAAFPDVARRAPSGFVHYAVDSYPLRLLMLDTQDEGRDGGLLCAERLGWIGRRLAESSRPTLIFMHHPPFDYGLASNPDMHCAGADRFGQIVARHRHVEGIFAGHLHRATIVRWCGTVAGTVPATAPLFQLPLAGGAPAGWIGAAAGLGLHLWRPGGGVVSHVVAVDEPARLVPFAKRA